MKRRTFFKYLALLSPTVLFTSCMGLFKEKTSMINQIIPIDFQWPMQGPFLFCAHHYDKYPVSNTNNGLDSNHFNGRQMGSDFNLKDGFRIYHGKEIPGFPVHPHRGFETITIVTKGYVDHADSLGAAGRYGEGDVQWMTAGKGVQHSEMFPLLHKDKENHLELFQVWLNLPSKNKMVDPDFQMLWSEEIPVVTDSKIKLTLINGEYKNKKYYKAPKNSWAAQEENSVNVFLVELENDGVFEMPESSSDNNRSLYFYEGESLLVENKHIPVKNAIYFNPTEKIVVQSKGKTKFLYLEARKINEPIVQHGPFVMNSKQEIVQTIQDYQMTQFGGWPWERQDMIHGDKIERFAKYPNGKIVKPS